MYCNWTKIEKLAASWWDLDLCFDLIIPEPAISPPSCYLPCLPVNKTWCYIILFCSKRHTKAYFRENIISGWSAQVGTTFLNRCTRGGEHAGANGVRQQPQPAGPLAGARWDCTVHTAQVSWLPVPAADWGRGVGGGMQSRYTTWPPVHLAPAVQCHLLASSQPWGWASCGCPCPSLCLRMGWRGRQPLDSSGLHAFPHTLPLPHLHCADCTAQKHQPRG